MDKELNRLAMFNTFLSNLNSQYISIADTTIHSTLKHRDKNILFIEQISMVNYNKSIKKLRTVHMTKKIKKTNAMRYLDQVKIHYDCYEYDDSDNMIDGITVANMIGKDPSLVFKTLVTTSDSHVHYVFVLPVNQELDLKKAAKVVEEKKIELIPVKDIEKTTGYIKGGCSPIGMKKSFVTIFHESALQNNKIICNGGKVGIQIEIDSNLIEKILHCRFADICIEDTSE